MVWPSFYAACDRRLGSEVLLHGTPTGFLDRGAPLDDPSDRRGPSIGRLPEGTSNERARCLRGVPVDNDTPGNPGQIGQSRLNAKFRADAGGPTHMRVAEHRQGRVRESFSGERAEIAALGNEIESMWYRHDANRWKRPRARAKSKRRGTDRETRT